MKYSSQIRITLTLLMLSTMFRRDSVTYYRKKPTSADMSSGHAATHLCIGSWCGLCTRHRVSEQKTHYVITKQYVSLAEIGRSPILTVPHVLSY